MSNAYLLRMPSGFPGVVNRVDQATIEPQIMDPDTPVTAFGKFVKFVSGKVQPIAASDAATVVQGLLVKPYPTQEPSSNEAIGAGTPDKYAPCNVLKRGYMTVTLNKGTATKGGQVYVRVTASGDDVVGQIETAADSGKCVAVTGCFFTGAADSSGNVEVAYNI